MRSPDRNLFEVRKIRDDLPPMNNLDYLVPEMQHRLYCSYFRKITTHNEQEDAGLVSRKRV